MVIKMTKKYAVIENNKVINKIKVTPKRNSEPAMEGYIYIVDDTYAIYAVDLSIKGSQMQNPALNKLTLKQSYSFNNKNKIWAKTPQTFEEFLCLKKQVLKHICKINHSLRYNILTFAEKFSYR
jgi:hypothetical protein